MSDTPDSRDGDVRNEFTAWQHAAAESFFKAEESASAPAVSPVSEGPTPTIAAIDIKTFRDAVAAVVRVGGPAQMIPCDQLLRLCDSHEALRATVASLSAPMDATAVDELLDDYEQWCMNVAARVGQGGDALDEAVGERNKVRTEIRATLLSVASLTAECERLRGENGALREKNERAESRTFPIQDGPNILWSAIAPHEDFARINHGGQTLERLAARGGLSVVEAIHLLAGVRWGTVRSKEISALPQREAIDHLQSLAAAPIPHSTD